jgi:hypothetical protein
LDYEITESAFEVVTLTTLPPTLFTELIPPVPSKPPSTRPASPSAVLSSELELLTVELQAHYALHQLKACLGKPVHVKRSNARRVEVGGLAETAEERDELRAALRTVPGTVFSVQTVAEAVQTNVSASSVSTSDPLSPSDTRITLRSGRMPLQLQLQQYFSRIQAESNPDSVESLSNGAITLSRSIVLEAWALRHLAESYKGNRIEHLPSYARVLLQNMVQDHMSSLRLGVERERHLLEPVLLSIFPQEPALQERLGDTKEPGKPWSDSCMDLFGRAEEVRSIVDALFANAGTEADSELMARRLVELLSHWTRQFPSVEIEIVRQLSGESQEFVQRSRETLILNSSAGRP